MAKPPLKSSGKFDYDGLLASGRLPSLLQEIADATDARTALLIAESGGGMRQYFAANPPATNWLVRIVGMTKAVKIARAVCPGKVGVTLDVPLAADIRKHIRILELAAAGVSNPKAALIMECDVRSIKRVKSHYLNNPNPDYRPFMPGKTKGN